MSAVLIPRIPHISGDIRHISPDIGGQRAAMCAPFFPRRRQRCRAAWRIWAVLADWRAIFNAHAAEGLIFRRFCRRTPLARIRLSEWPETGVRSKNALYRLASLC